MLREKIFFFLVTLEKFSSCPKVQTLNLRGNAIVEVASLEPLRNLWSLDLSNNQVLDENNR